MNMGTILFFVAKSLYPQSSCRVQSNGMGRLFRHRGWNLQLVECSSPGFSLKQALDFWRPLGVIIGTGLGLEKIRASDMRGIPVAYSSERYGAKGRGLYVELDSAEVGRMAAEELLGLNLKHFAYAASVCRECWCQVREAAFVAEVRKGGGILAPTFAPVRGESLIARRSRMESWLAGLPKPCGVFASNDITSEEVLLSARRRKIAVPDDLAILGVDNIADICENAVPTLSSIAVDFESAAFRVASLLADRIDGKIGPVGHVLYRPQGVVRRESTRRMPDADRRVPEALEFIRREARNGIGVDDVAAAIGLRRRQAEVLFRQAIGRTVADELLARRIEIAKQELRNPRQQIFAIAGLCGWASETSLRRAFRKATGHSMREWRLREMHGFSSD